MKIIPFPGLEDDVRMYVEDLSREEVDAIMAPKIQEMLAYKLPSNIEVIDFEIPGPDEGQSIPLHMVRPKGLKPNAPVVIDFHGGGWIQGEGKADDSRNCQIISFLPCIFIAPDYRLSSETMHFPAPHLDALAVYQWALEHVGEYGGDQSRIALYGTSAGGNIAAGLQLKIRDLGLPQPAVCIFNCPALSKGETPSKQSIGKGIGPANTLFAHQAEYIYDPPTGQIPSYYAFPSFCPDLSGLGPTSVIIGEYDPLRSEGLAYATRLLDAGVPTEIHVVSGVSHAFCGNIKAPLVKHTVKGIAMTLSRWFGMGDLRS